MVLNAAQFHLLLNHVPVIGSIFALAVLAWGLLRRSPEVQRAAMLAMVVIAVFTVVAYLTGKGAEEVVEHLPGISHDLVEEHEEAALWAGWLLVATGLAAAWALWAGRGGRRAPGWTTGAVLLLGALGFAASARTAHLGGLIRHPEIRSDGVSAPASDDGDADRARSPGRRGE